MRRIIADAQSELGDLEVAERVIERLAADQNDDQDAVLSQGQRKREPTIADMAVKFLEEVGPMTTAQLLEHMRQNWREGLADTTLTSTLSRTKKAGRIDYKDGLWLVPVDDRRKENEPPTGGSEVEEVTASSDPDQPRLMPGMFTIATTGSGPAPRSGGEGGD